MILTEEENNKIILTEEAKNKIIQERRSKKEFITGLLPPVIETMEKDPYCRGILEGANYQKFLYTQRKPEKFDINGFYLEEIYTGPHHGPMGHCTKELYEKDDDPSDPINGTRDVAYIADNVYTALRIGKFKNDEEMKKLDKRTKKIVELFLVNICSHECSHGNQSNRRDWKAQRSRAEEYQNYNEVYPNAYAGALAVEQVAQKEENKGDFDLEKVENERKQKLGWLLGHFKVKTYDELSNDVKNGIEVKKEELKKLVESGGAISQGTGLTEEQAKLGYLCESIDEAGVMADSFIALLSVLSKEEDATYAEDAIDQLLEATYDSRMTKEGRKMLRSISPEDLSEMFELNKSETGYTDEAIKRQQKLGREIFKDILPTMFADYMRNKFMKREDLLPKLEEVINTPQAHEMIVSAYEPRCLGTPEEFLEGAFPEGLLTDESKNKLMESLNEAEKQYKERQEFQSENKLRENEAETQYKVTRAFHRTKSKLVKEEKNETTSSQSSNQMQPARSSDMEM